jgi:hypothetical protein
VARRHAAERHGPESNFIPGRYHGWIDDGFLYEC